MTDITIMSVVHQFPQMYYANVELIRLMNRDSNIRFLCCQNHEEFGRPKMDGVEFMAGSDTTAFQPRGMQISLACAIDLNRMSRMTDTRYVLSLHHDFYCVQKGWIERVIAHMKAKDLAFFGAPYHPRHYRKLLGFPTDHFMLIDTEKVNRGAIDWRPNMANHAAQWHGNNARKLRLKWDKFRGWKIWDHRLGPKQYDCGSILYEDYYRKAAYELLVPGYDWWRQYPTKGPIGRIHQAIDFIFRTERRPRKYVIVPFEAYGFPPPPMETEEWYWRGFPFAFHFRLSKRQGFGQGKNDLRQVQIGMQAVNRYVMTLARMYEKQPWNFGND